MDSNKAPCVVVVTPAVKRGDGQGRVNYETIVAALERGMHVTVLAHELEQHLQSHPKVEWIRFVSSRFPTALLRSKGFSIESFRWLRRNSSKYDVLHINGNTTLFPSDVNVVHFVHGAWSRSTANKTGVIGPRRLYHKLLTAIGTSEEKVAYMRAKRIVGVSEQVRNELVSIGVDRSKIDVVHNGVDTDEFTVGDSKRSDYHLPDDRFLAVWAGEMSTSRKNLETVLKAIKELDSVHLAVIGSLVRNPYPKLVQKMGLEQRVTFLGYRRDVNKIMQCADAFVFPSRYETCSLVCLEALASGVPVITAKTTGGWELIDSDSGFVFENPNDYHSINTTLRQLIDNPELLGRMRVAARKQALRNTFHAMAHKYVDIYEKIIREKSQSKPRTDGGG